jgi:hypothetical protein
METDVHIRFPVMFQNILLSCSDQRPPEEERIFPGSKRRALLLALITVYDNQPRRCNRWQRKSRTVDATSFETASGETRCLCCTVQSTYNYPKSVSSLLVNRGKPDWYW